ncbi:MAG: hypothetical protein HOV80_11320 [Polyangiaceae bacterium]|nr:hypothetical protein [Polyangiaceae bacterium]
MKYVAALGLLGLVGTGCTVDVQIGTPGAICFTEGGDGALVAHREGEVSTNGCVQCECFEDGDWRCKEVDCPKPCTFEDMTVPLGAAVPAQDGCNTCTCQEDGTLVCTDDLCGCDAAPPPMCAPSSPYCFGAVVCENDRWLCVDDCPCGDAMPPSCPQVPTGCAWTGPICDAGTWSCGELICDGCASMPACSDPMQMGCYADAWCDGFAWQCVIGCNECPDAPPQDCFARNADIGCTPEPYCDPIYGWQCGENCGMGACSDPQPVCDYLGPNCYGQPICLESTWYCEFVCN